jgi:hypothetical protein
VLREGRDGTIWCGTMKRLYRLVEKAGRFELLAVDVGIAVEQTKEVNVLDLLEDHSGSLWIASFEGLFRLWPDGRTARYTKNDGLPDNNIHDLLEDHQGRLWMGTRLGGFFHFAAADDHSSPVVAESYDQRNGLPTNWIFQLFETAIADSGSRLTRAWSSSSQMATAIIAGSALIPERTA